MKTNSISMNRIITPRTTGYAATVGLGLSIWSGISKRKQVRRTHKPIAYITALLTALHIGLIEYYKHKYK